MRSVAVFEAKNRFWELLSAVEHGEEITITSHGAPVARLMAFVLDNSVVTGWYLPDQATAYTQAVATRMETEKALVPALWQLALADVLKTACTRGKLSMDAARQILDTLGALPIEVDAGPAPGQRQLFELAMRYQLSSYDAAYLELAQRHGLALATQDAQLRDAAAAAGLAVL